MRSSRRTVPSPHPIAFAGTASRPDSLKFSMNNADVEQFRAIARVKGQLFDDSIANLKAARKVRDEGRFSCGLYPSSIRYDGVQQERMQKLVDEILPHVDEHYWLPLYSMGSLAKDRERELGYRPIAGNQGRLGALREPLRAIRLHRRAHHARRQALRLLFTRAIADHGGPHASPVHGRLNGSSSASCARRISGRCHPCGDCVAYSSYWGGGGRACVALETRHAPSLPGRRGERDQRAAPSARSIAAS